MLVPSFFYFFCWFVASSLISLLSNYSFMYFSRIVSSFPCVGTLKTILVLSFVECSLASLCIFFNTSLKWHFYMWVVSLISSSTTTRVDSNLWFPLSSLDRNTIYRQNHQLVHQEYVMLFLLVFQSVLPTPILSMLASLSDLT